MGVPMDQLSHKRVGWLESRRTLLGVFLGPCGRRLHASGGVGRVGELQVVCMVCVNAQTSLLSIRRRTSSAANESRRQWCLRSTTLSLSAVCLLQPASATSTDCFPDANSLRACDHNFMGHFRAYKERVVRRPFAGVS